MNLGSESETVEFKKSTGEHKEAMQAISAMLNKQGFGELYFGVKDDGEVIGQDVSDSTLRQVAGWLADKISPRVVPSVEALSSEGKSYIRVAFCGSEAPYSADGRYFIRVGTSNQPMTQPQFKAAMLDRILREQPWDSMPSGRQLGDADEAAVRDFVRRGNQAARIRAEFGSVEEVVSNLGMLAEDGTLTNAADVLFCHAPVGRTRMSVALLAGNDKVRIRDLHHKDGPLLSLLDDAVDYVLENIRREMYIPDDGSVERVEIPEIPARAVREAVANALVHRDYMDGAAIEVCVYRDTVQISSPGLFPAGDTPESHYAPRPRSHRPRNAAIADAVYRAGAIEKFGTGIPRIKEECDKAGVTFRYEQDQGFTVVTFDRPGSQIAYVDGSGNPVPPPAGAWGSNQGKGSLAEPTRQLSAREQAAIDMARERGRVTTKDLSDAEGVSRDTARATLRRLADEGILEKVAKGPRDPHQHYRPVKHG